MKKNSLTLCIGIIFSWIILMSYSPVNSKMSINAQNPYAVAINQWLNAREKIRIPESMEGPVPSVRHVGEYTLYRAWGLTHPLSELKDPSLIAWHKERLVDEINFLLDAAEFYNGRFIPGGAWNIDRFVLRHLLDTFYRLKTNNLFPAEMDEWLHRAKMPVEWQYINYWNGPGQEYLPGWNTSAGYYPNSDAMFILVMGLAGVLYDEPAYLKRAHEFVGHLDRCMLPDGGFKYIFNDNEITNYHSLNVISLARYWLVTEDNYALEVIKKTSEFYPLTFGAAGVTQKTGYPWFKKQMSATLEPAVADIVAAVKGDGRHKYFALDYTPKEDHHSNDVIAVDFWRDDIQPVIPENHFIRRDRNMNGIRGRFGDFSWVTTFGHGAPMDAFVGALISPASKESNANYSSLEMVSPEVCMINSQGAHRNTHAFVTGVEYHRDLMIQEEFGAISVSYQLHLPWRETFSGYPVERESVPWTAHQLWMLLPDKVLGYITMECDKNHEAEYVRTRIRVAPYNAVLKTGDNAYSVNDLNINIRKHNFSSSEITDPAQTSYGTYPASRLGKEIVYSTLKKNYNKDKSYFLFLEAFPDNSTPLSDMAVNNTKGLMIFSFRDHGYNYEAVYNTTNASQRFEKELRGDEKIFRYNREESLKQGGGTFSTEIESRKMLVLKWK